MTDTPFPYTARFRSVEPFIDTMNVIDTQHLRALHGLDVEDVNRVSDGGSFHADMTISGDYVGLPETTRHVELIGTNAAVYSRATTGIDMLAAATPYRGRTRLYIVTGGLRSDRKSTRLNSSH